VATSSWKGAKVMAIKIVPKFSVAVLEAISEREHRDVANKLIEPLKNDHRRI
jgi:hypothetical protein